MYQSVYDNRDGVSEYTTSLSSPFSLTHVHSIGSRNGTPTDTAYPCETDVSKYVWQEEWHNPVYVRRVDSSTLVFESFITQILIYKSCLYLNRVFGITLMI